jgi:hypothetical protein
MSVALAGGSGRYNDNLFMCGFLRPAITTFYEFYCREKVPVMTPRAKGGGFPPLITLYLPDFVHITCTMHRI